MFSSSDIQGRICSYQTGGPKKPGLCGKQATQHRIRHSIANVGKDNFFKIDVFYCDEHAEEFDNNPPPGEAAWRDYSKRRDLGIEEPGAAAKDPYLGLKKTDPYNTLGSHKRDGGGNKGHSFVVDMEKEARDEIGKPPPKKQRGKKAAKPTCTNEMIDGSSCGNPVADRFIGKGDLYQLCDECAELLMIE